MGTKFKVFNGYPDSAAVGLAMEQGEVEGYCGFTYGSVRSSRPQWLERNLVSVFMQMAPAKHPDLPNTPNALDFMKTDAERDAFLLVFGLGKMGRPVAAPPGVPADRFEALRKAFYETVNSPGLIEEAKKLKMELELVSGPEVTDLIRSAYATPPAIVERIKKVMKRD